MINQLKLNLASGQQRIEGYFNIDKAAAPNVDYVWNLEDYPWPIEDESAIEIICNHYIEHIPHDSYSRRLLKLIQESPSWDSFRIEVNRIDIEAPSDGLILFMNELHRILKPRGEAYITTPYYTSGLAHQDPTHCRYITEVTYRYFNKEWLLVSNLEHYNIKADFDFKLMGYYYFEDVKYQSDDEKKFATRCWNNVITAMKVKLTKL
jgi:predicted SAM-dependent methyltransferase